MLRRLLFHNFRFVFNLDHWVKRHFTQAGMLVLGGLVAAGVFGIDTRQTFAYQLFSMCLALLLLAVLSSRWIRLTLTAHRELPRFATVDETLQYRVRLQNQTPNFQNNLSLQDYVKQHSPDFQSFLHTRMPTQEKHNWFDNYVGYPRWLWLLRNSRGADIASQEVPPIPPQGEIEVYLTLVPLRRGYVHFTDLAIACPDPLGLFNALYSIPLPDSLLVLPKRYPVGEVVLPGSQKYQQGGVQMAMTVGDAQEFMSLRDYRPGDPLRHIHWKSWAKTGTPVVKEYQDEFFVRQALVLDTFTSQQPPINLSAFEAAVSVAASLVCAPRSQEVLLDLMFVGPQAYCFTSGRGLSQHDELLETLACVQPCVEHPFSQLSATVMKYANSLSGCICIFLTWEVQRKHLVQSLRSMEIPLLILIITDEQLEVAEEEMRVWPVDKVAEGMKGLAGGRN